MGRGNQRFRIGDWRCLKNLRIAMRGKTCQILIGFLGLESRGKFFLKQKGIRQGWGDKTALTPGRRQ
jgi:hypothetical protein